MKAKISAKVFENIDAIDIEDLQERINEIIYDVIKDKIQK